MSELALAESFRAAPEIHLTVEQTTLSDGAGKAPVWVTGHEKTTIEAALDGDPSVDSYTMLDENDDEWLYALEFSSSSMDIVRFLCECNGVIIDTTVSGEQWVLTVRFPTRQDLARVRDGFAEDGIEVTFEQIHTGGHDARTAALTDAQYEVIEAALEGGYFDVPRGASLEDLADELGISHQAASERLRRAEKRALSGLRRDNSTSTGRIDGDARGVSTD